MQFSGPVGGGTVSLTAQTPHLANAWVTAASIADKAGQAPTSSYIKQVCGSAVTAGPLNAGLKGAHVRGGGLFGGNVSAVQAGQRMQGALSQCFHTLSANYHEVVTYQPASRFWTFQTIETALFVALAVALGGFCAWWVRHRVS
jgi:hypothetical protein